MDEVLDTEETKKHKGKSHWSEDNLIWYDDQGEGWAIGKTGNRVCICQEKDFGRVLSGEVPLESCTNPKQREALEIIINIRREIQENGNREVTTTRKSNANRRGHLAKRARPLSGAKHHGSNTRHFAQPKRLSLHKNNKS